MKLEAVLSYALSIAEGALAGVCFCRAKQTREIRPKVLLYIASALSFAASVLDGLEGGRMLREPKTPEINGGNDDE